MPVYEFACDACDSRFERLMRFDSLATGVGCPTCGRSGVRRLVSAFAALSRGQNGETVSVAGGGCACSTGGGCGCGCH